MPFVKDNFFKKVMHTFSMEVKVFACIPPRPCSTTLSHSKKFFSGPLTLKTWSYRKTCQLFLLKLNQWNCLRYYADIKALIIKIFANLLSFNPRTAQFLFLSINLVLYHLHLLALKLRTNRRLCAEPSWILLQFCPGRK